MLVLDIETLGLLFMTPLPPITCVCLYDEDTKRQYRLRMHRTPEYHANAALIRSLLRGARHIVGYNAVLFDLEYLRRSLHVPSEEHEAWVKKCVDPFLAMKCALQRTCKLQVLLQWNNLGSKTGTGGDAVQLAKDGRWDELLDYCMADVRLTHELCTLPWIFVHDGMKMRFDRDASQWGFLRGYPPKDKRHAENHLQPMQPLLEAVTATVAWEPVALVGLPQGCSYAAA